MTLKIGKKAPDFALKDKDGKIFRLSEIYAEYTIVYFYPRDSTPGCTIEANEFTSLLNEFKRIGASVIGISGRNEESKKKFCEKNNLKVTLLSDLDFKVCNDYRTYGEKQFMGRTFDGIFRTTYVLDKDKKVIKVYEGVKAKSHAKEVLEFLRGLKDNGA